MGLASSLFITSNDTPDKERPTSPLPPSLTYDSDTSTSSFEDIIIEPDESLVSSVQTYSLYTVDECLLALRSIQDGDLSNEKVIKALPRRRNKSQRLFALQLAKLLFTELTDLAALIYMSARSSETAWLLSCNRKTMLVILPLTRLPGPTPRNPSLSLAESKDYTGTRGVELLWNSPLAEFERGIVYYDSRLDLCKKVVGLTHIGQLMKSLESNNQIKHFLLSNNVISATGAKIVADFIAKIRLGKAVEQLIWFQAGKLSDGELNKRIKIANEETLRDICTPMAPTLLLALLPNPGYYECVESPNARSRAAGRS
ncbi:hypothetical protein BKA64DRAFT_646628 [Cadophora sp. MPI-SDFR-AT-0126]|nr:hypothetical protein BKA64DRAFT_646628 [Leotiomycetes sp. MPI-SDFR-AT-0126]